MVKKKNKTLESVLIVLNALDNKISQPIVEKVLKECNGSTEKAIDTLRSVILRDQIAARKIESAQENVKNELLRVASVISEISSLLGPLNLDMELFTEVIRNERYDVERCTERYFELIEVYNVNEIGCEVSYRDFSPDKQVSTSNGDMATAVSGNSFTDQVNVEYSINDSVENTSSADTSIDSTTKNPKVLTDASDNVDLVHLCLSQECGDSGTSQFHVENATLHRYESRKENFCSDDKSSKSSQDFSENQSYWNREFEEERAQVDLAMNYVNDHEMQSTHCQNSHISDEENINYIPCGDDEAQIQMEHSCVEMGIYLDIFAGLADRSDLVVFWNDSYKHQTSMIMSGAEVDISLVMNEAISVALIHIEDRENDWDESIDEANMTANNNGGYNCHNYSDANIYGYDDNESLNYELIETLAALDEESDKKRNAEKNSTTKDVLLDMVRSVLGENTFKFSEKFILHALDVCDYNLDRTVDYMLSNQSTHTPSLDFFQNRGANSLHKFADPSFSYANVLTSNISTEKNFYSADSEGNHFNPLFGMSNTGYNIFTDFEYENHGFGATHNTPTNNVQDMLDSDDTDTDRRHHMVNANPWSANNQGSGDRTYGKSGDDYNGGTGNTQNNDSDNSSKTRDARSKVHKGKALQWRLVASKEGAKMKQALLRESSQSTIPQAVYENRAQCKQRLLAYGNIAAKYALQEKNPNIHVCITPSGQLEFTGFAQKRDFFHGDQNAQNHFRNGGDDFELSGQAKKIVIESFDLHGLLVREAIQFVNSIFKFYGTENRMILRFIVGRGNHSVGRISRLGPALRQYLGNRNIPYTTYDGEIKARINA